MDSTVPTQMSQPISKGLVADLVLCLLAILAGFLLPNNFKIHDETIFIFNVCLYLGSAFFSLLITKSWQSVWRWTSSDDLIKILQSVLLATAIYCTVIALSKNDLKINTTISISILMMSFMMGARGFARLLNAGGNFMALSALYRPIAQNAPAAILVGPTEAIATSIHQTRKNGPLPFRPVAIISTLGNQIGKVFSGAKVYSSEHFEETLKRLLKTTLKSYGNARIILVGENQSEQIKQAVMNAMYDNRVRISRMPEIGSKELTNVSPADVLGRKHHTLSSQLPPNFIKDKVVMITGGGGTIGSELAVQVAAYQPKLIVIVDSSENNLYRIDIKLKEKYPKASWVIKLKDIRDHYSIDDLFDEYKPNIVFHAAANKHVPIMEFHPREAIMVNIGGTKNVADAAIRTGTDVFILVSTDKAVNPSNLMGTAKRAAELYIRHCFEDYNRKFFSVRFGNVLGSSGSVMPLFEHQISHMGPVTVTSRKMTRWFMTVQEAVSLVLESAALGNGSIKEDGTQNFQAKNPLFVLDMGEPVKIVEFAEAMVRLRGYEPYVDIPIIETGIRPGEKLHEELFYASETVDKTPVKGVLSAHPNTALNDDTIELINNAIKAAKKNDIPTALDYLKRIVPEYEPAKN